MKSLCLASIVKNEVSILKRMFDSVCEYIDYWVIHDTGSTDGTQDFIRSYFEEKGIEGELIEKPWIDFGYNRTELLKSAKNKSDYLILCDADYVINMHDKKFKSKLTEDLYYISHDGDVDYKKATLAKASLPWKYFGRTHEILDIDDKTIAYKSDVANFFTINHIGDGNNKSDKYERDIRLLKEDLCDDENNSRTWFYLGQSYKGLNEYCEAINCYKRASELSKHVEEKYYALFMIGFCMKLDKRPFWDCFQWLMKAYLIKQNRLEALHLILILCDEEKYYKFGFSLGMMAINNTYPKTDFLFVDRYVHTYKFWLKLSSLGVELEEYEIVNVLLSKALSSKEIDVNDLPMVKHNKQVIEKKLSLLQKKNKMKNNNVSKLSRITL